MKLYISSHAPNPRRVSMFILEKGITGIETEMVDILAGEQRSERFLAKNPLGGQHHLAFEVPDIAAARAEFKAMGKRVLGPTRIGEHGMPVFFVHPRDMAGVLTEIMETPAHG